MTPGERLVAPTRLERAIWLVVFTAVALSALWFVANRMDADRSVNPPRAPGSISWTNSPDGRCHEDDPCWTN